MDKLEKSVQEGNTLLQQLNSILNNQLTVSERNTKRLELTEANISVIIQAFNRIEERVKNLEVILQSFSASKEVDPPYGRPNQDLVPVSPKRKRIKAPSRDNHTGLSLPEIGTRTKVLRKKIRKQTS